MTLQPLSNWGAPPPPRPTRGLLPSAVALVWLLAWGAAIYTLAAHPQAPRLLQASGVDCQFAHQPRIAVEDALWTGCGRTEPQWVRFDFEDGTIRSWGALPGVIDAAVSDGDGRLILVLTAADDERSRTLLYRLNPDGTAETLADFEAPPHSVRAARAAGPGFELVLADCRWVGVNAGGKPAFMALPGCPDTPGAALEWARSKGDGWDVVWSEERSKPTDLAFGRRAVFHEGREIGALRAARSFPFGDYLEFAPGGAINGIWPGTWRYSGEGSLVEVAATIPDKDAGWMLTAGPGDYILQDDALIPVRRWLHASRPALTLSVGARFLHLEGPLRGWRPFDQTIAPASDGGWWLADSAGRYQRVDDDLEPQRTAGFGARLARVLTGRATKAAAAGWLFLVAPFALLALMWALRRRFLIGDLIGGLYIIGCGLLYDAFRAVLDLM